MSEHRGFSFASVLISWLMIAGGISGAFLGAAFLHVSADESELLFYGVFGVGAFVGAFFAARASAGSTIVEPVLGAVLTIATLCGLMLATPVGQLVWHLGAEQAAKPAAISGGAALIGALVGAYVSEKAFGEATRSSVPWILYVAFAVIGGCFLATYVMIAFASRQPSTVGEAANRSQALVLVIGIGSGCLLAGLASGASARTRILIASFMGGLFGVFGFFYLFQVLTVGAPKTEEILGAAVVAAGGGIVSLIGTALGWAVVGKKTS
jgi:hypothetical protein